MDNPLQYVQTKPGTVFQCTGSKGEYLAVYTGSWTILGPHVKMEVIKLVENQNHQTERINATEINNAIDRENIFTVGDTVRVPFHIGTVQDLKTEEFVIVAIKTASVTKMRWPRLIALNAEYAKAALAES